MKLSLSMNVKEEFHFTTPKQSTLSASHWEQNSGSIYSPKLFAPCISPNVKFLFNLRPSENFFFLFLHL